MKKLILPALMFLGLIFTGNVKAQVSRPDSNAPVIKFEKDTVNYGNIPYDSDNRYCSFKFTNTGKNPLIIKESHCSCDFIEPIIPKEPVQPGQSSEIKVHYGFRKVGFFIKALTVTSNAVNSPTVIYVKGNGLPDSNAPVIKFEKDTIDYGTIAYNADGARIFKFTNTGKKPLIIVSALGSDGGLVAQAPKDPIQPGQSSEIKVHFWTQRVGHFFKVIEINSNASNSLKTIYIKGNILPGSTTNK